MALAAVTAETTVDTPLPASVLAQRAPLRAWLQGHAASVPRGQPAVEPNPDGPNANGLSPARGEGEPDDRNHDRALSDVTLQRRLRAAGLLALGRAEDYLRLARGRAEDVRREADIAARRRLGIHRPSYARLGVVGASVSAGFLGIGVSRLLREAAPDATVVDGSATLFFRKTPAERRALRDEIIRARPSVTLALDVLFWWTHGRASDGLERGLRQLEDVPGLIVLGTVPRMTSAKRWIMSRVRTAADLARINARIATWAEARPRVIVVPLHRWYADRTATVAPVAGDAAVAVDRLFAPDGLHLTALGTRFMVRRTLAVLADALPDAPPPRLSWSPPERQSEPAFPPTPRP
ncbi:MAG: SGNH/GDSL hydrolase family protein [Myxococcota bacterium]